MSMFAKYISGKCGAAMFIDWSLEWIHWVARRESLIVSYRLFLISALETAVMTSKSKNEVFTNVILEIFELSLKHFGSGYYEKLVFSWKVKYDCILKDDFDTNRLRAFCDNWSQSFLGSLFLIDQYWLGSDIKYLDFGFRVALWSSRVNLQRRSFKILVILQW